TGREIGGSDILQLASELTAMYRNAGYILSLVLVPPQSLAEGTLTLQVVEGYVNAVTVQAGEGVSATVRDSLARIGEQIKASRPLHALVLERYLLIANDFPGIELRSILSPSRVQGAADLTLVANVKRMEGFASVDNYGSKYLGPGQILAGITGNQLLGVNDQWRAIAVGTGDREMAYGQLSYSQVVNTEGLKLSAAVSRARTQPGDVLKPFDVRGAADTTSISATYPLRRSRNESLFARVTYDHSDIRTDILGTRVIEDRIRALRLGLSWRVLDRFDGQNALELDFSQGLGGTDESDLLKSRAGAKGVFNLTIDGTVWAANVGHGGGTGLVVLPPGPHQVGETAGAATSLGEFVPSYSGDCNAAGAVTLVAGQSSACTITNTRMLWTAKALMPTPRLYFGIGAIGNHIYVVGGANSGLGRYATLERYTPATDTWVTKTPMSLPRDGLGVGIINGILYAVGGKSYSSMGSGVTGRLEA
ncbi:MAG: POTRA domain-containing protein, partial [Polaromonas sp.]|nr:POTRA domain-containing protein [Polaromonas sp.]